MGGDGLKRVIISGAPASGKGTQCEKIVEQVGAPFRGSQTGLARSTKTDARDHLHLHE